MISADAIICIDESQRITFFNEGAETIFGYRAEEALGQQIEMLIPVRFRASHRYHVNSFGSSGVRARRMGERREISGLRKSGEEFPAEAAISHLGVEDKNVYSVVLRDMTFRRRTELSQRFLAEAGEKLASSLGTDQTMRTVANLAVPTLADAAFVTTFHDGTFRGVAVAHVDQASGISLQTRREQLQLTPSGIQPLADVVLKRRPHFVRDAKTDDAGLGPFLRGIGEIFDDAPVASALFLPLVARGQMLGVTELYTLNRRLEAYDVVLAEDLTRLAALSIDNARLHEQVMLGSQARDDIIGIVSHDLRNPVNAVKMLTGAILGAERDSPLPGDVVEYSAVILQASEQMDSLIRDLLDVTRIEAGRLKVEADATDISDLLDDALQTLTPVASAKSIGLRLDVDRSLPLVEADRERIRQALSNLIGNSVKFSPAGTTILLRADKLDGEVVVAVTDEGPGMTAEQLAHAFDRFWQSRRTDREGAGLGLAITQGIIEAHGGRIWAESRVGQGSTFHFTLPIASTRHAGTEVSP